MPKVFFISDLKVGDNFSDYFLVSTITFRPDKSGNTFLDVTLGDRTGSLNGKMFNLSGKKLSGLKELSPGEIVKADGVVTEWNEKRQLTLSAVTKYGNEFYKAEGLRGRDFFKSAPEEPEEMYAYIKERAESISDGGLRAVALEFLKNEKERLLYYPAAVSIHHAERGGLLWHIKRMLMLGEKACEVYDFLDRDWVVCGVILHDMEKLNEIKSEKSGVSPGYSVEGNLLGHITQGVKTVDRMARSLGLDSEKAVLLEHMIVSHHNEPEFGSPKRPMFPEAELLHRLDMLDANLYQFEEITASIEPGSFSERIFSLDGRMIYKPSFR